jgi:hypothetical protein
MIAYIRIYAVDKLLIDKENLQLTTNLVFKMCKIKEEKLQRVLS